MPVYEDDYNTFGFKSIENIVNTYDDRTKGFKTYEHAAILDGTDVTNQYIERAFYYDYKGRVIQTVEKNHLGGISRYSTKYDFVGNVLASHESHQASTGVEPDVKITTFEYDHRSRLLSETTTLNDGQPAVVSYGYDELGKLASRTYGEVGDANAITETYEYNIQGWLTNKSSDLFDMALRYYDPQKPDTKASYAGNITEWEWEHKDNGADTSNTYAFTYDKLSRLIDTKRYEGDSDTLVNSFTERGLSYDRNGNILTLQRYGTTAGVIDNDLAYTYNGNQLDSLNGGQYTYAYDANGNMTRDGRNALNLSYNYLNLVSEVRDSDDVPMATYSWLADGTKAGVVNGSGDFGLEYLGSLVYRRNAGGELSLESTAFGGGRIEVADTGESLSYTPNYFLTDHLGSTRVVVNGQTGEITERNDYFPFGKRIDLASGAISGNRYRYNSKEEQFALGINYLDFGWRMYDHVVGRWFSMDKKSEKYFDLSPYNYVGGNPIVFVDPFGLDYWSTNDPSKIRVAMSQLQNGHLPSTYGWETHVKDEDFLSNLYYNDETNKYWATWSYVENDIIKVYSKSFNGYTLGYPNRGSLTEQKLNIFGRYNNSRFGQTWVGRMLYGMINDPAVAIQSYLMMEPRALDGFLATPQEKLNAGVTSTAGLIGNMSGGLQCGAKALNASQFNKLHRGTKMNAKKGSGIHIRRSNNSTEQINQLEKVRKNTNRAINYGTTGISSLDDE